MNNYINSLNYYTIILHYYNYIIYDNVKYLKVQVSVKLNENKRLCDKTIEYRKPKCRLDQNFSGIHWKWLIQGARQRKKSWIWKNTNEYIYLIKLYNKIRSIVKQSVDY